MDQIIKEPIYCISAKYPLSFKEYNSSKVIVHQEIVKNHLNYKGEKLSNHKSKLRNFWVKLETKLQFDTILNEHKNGTYFTNHPNDNKTYSKNLINEFLELLKEYQEFYKFRKLNDNLDESKYIIFEYIELAEQHLSVKILEETFAIYEFSETYWDSFKGKPSVKNGINIWYKPSNNCIYYINIYMNWKISESCDSLSDFDKFEFYKNDFYKLIKIIKDLNNTIRDQKLELYELEDRVHGNSWASDFGSEY